MALGSTHPLVGKGGRCMRLTTSPPLRAECHGIWEPKSPESLWDTPDLLQDAFTFFICYYLVVTSGLGNGDLVHYSRVRRADVLTVLLTEFKEDFLYLEYNTNLFHKTFTC